MPIVKVNTKQVRDNGTGIPKNVTQSIVQPFLLPNHRSWLRYIHLSETDQVTLQEAVRNHPSAIVRTRSQALLLSHRSYPVKELARLHQVRTRTIYDWFSRWSSMGLVGLHITQGRGRKSVLQPVHTPLVVETLNPGLPGP